MSIRIVSILLCLFMPAMLFASVITAPADQHSVHTIKEPAEAQEFFGTLRGFPHAFELTLHEPLIFTIQVFEHATDQNRDTTLLLVKQERRGVTEIGRAEGGQATWEEAYDRVFTETFVKGGVIQQELEPGSYLLEVSSPNNDSRYRLVLADDAVGYGYFEALRTLFALKSHYGSPYASVLLSPLVYLPLVVLVCGCFTYLAYRRKRGSV